MKAFICPSATVKLTANSSNRSIIPANIIPIVIDINALEQCLHWEVPKAVLSPLLHCPHTGTGNQGQTD